MGEPTEAKRLTEPPVGQFPEGFDTGLICYWRRAGIWMLYLPGGGLGNLTGHSVEEHDDGTITVSPSILLDGGRKDRRRHGYLRRGAWEPCGDDVDPREGKR